MGVPAGGILWPEPVDSKLSTAIYRKKREREDEDHIGKLVRVQFEGPCINQFFFLISIVV